MPANNNEYLLDDSIDVDVGADDAFVEELDTCVEKNTIILFDNGSIRNTSMIVVTRFYNML